MHWFIPVIFLSLLLPPPRCLSACAQVAPDGSDKRFISLPARPEGRGSRGDGEGEGEGGERGGGDASLRLSAADLGRRVVVMVTPVRSDGEEGESVESHAVGPVAAGTEKKRADDTNHDLT